MTKNESYDMLLDRIESSRDGGAIMDYEIQEFLLDKRDEKHLTNKQIDLSNKLFIMHMNRFEKKTQKQLDDKKKVEVHDEQRHIVYRRTIAQTWKPEQVDFIRQRIGVKTPKQIASEYNFNFASKGEARTESSIRTKVYRI